MQWPLCTSLNEATYSTGSFFYCPFPNDHVLNIIAMVEDTFAICLVGADILQFADVVGIYPVAAFLTENKSRFSRTDVIFESVNFACHGIPL
jgi:hypothetical protein